MNLEAVKTCFMLLYADLTEAAQQKEKPPAAVQSHECSYSETIPVVSEPFIDIHSGV